MTLLIDQTLNFLKWPFCLLALLMLPAAVPLFWKQVQFISTTQYLGLWVGLFGYVVLHQAIFRRRLFGSWLPTLEHEMTHAIFAWATLHSVGGLKLTWSKGGEIKVYGGQSNWLIVIAPYFFPTVPLLAMVLHMAWPQVYAGHFDVVMGVCLGFHVIATINETRLNQPDLQKVGFPFSFLFLPTANAVCLAWVLSEVSGHSGFWTELRHEISQIMNALTALF